jgi:hypothetical protein
MGGAMKFLQLVLGMGGSLCNYSCPWHRVHKNHNRADNMLLPSYNVIASEANYAFITQSLSVTDLWISLGTPISATKVVTEIFLKVVLNT